MQGEVGLVSDPASSNIWGNVENAEQLGLYILYKNMYFCKIKASFLFLLLLIFQ